MEERELTFTIYSARCTEGLREDLSSWKSLRLGFLQLWNTSRMWKSTNKILFILFNFCLKQVSVEYTKGWRKLLPGQVPQSWNTQNKLQPNILDCSETWGLIGKIWYFFCFKILKRNPSVSENILACSLDSNNKRNRCVCIFLQITK